VATKLLQKLSCHVDISNNGEEAIEKYLENDYEMIFMDCQMPIMNEYEATIEIRKLEKKITPILLLLHLRQML